MTADVTPAPDAPPAEHVAPRGRPAVRRLVGLLIVASWLAWAVPAWQSSLHEVRAHELASDIEAQRVVGYLAVENVRQPDHIWRVGLDVSWLAGFSPRYDVPASDVEGRPENGFARQLIYTVDGGRTRFVQDVVPGSGPDGPELFTALRASGAQPFRDAGAPPARDWAAYPGLLMVVLVIGSLVAWPPRRGTRPFWVLVATLFAGVGMIAYAVRELAADPPTSSEAPRLRWMHGFCAAVIGGLLLPPLLSLLH